MFEYKISDLEDSAKLIDTWATKCVSLLSPKYEEIYKSTPTRLVVFFDDIDKQPKQPSRYLAPKINQIEEVFQFTKSLNDSDRVLVHCLAGVGRSTAMLMGILCQHGYSPQDAFHAVQRIRPQLWPNNLVIEFCDKILRLNSVLINIVAQFKKTQKHRLFVPESFYTSTMRGYINILTPSQKND